MSTNKALTVVLVYTVLITLAFSMYTHAHTAVGSISHVVMLTPEPSLILEEALLQCHNNIIKAAPSLVPILKSASIVRLCPDNTRSLMGVH